MSKKTLIIAEKPSVAADIARALGSFEKHADFFENDAYVLASAVGHLLELHEPEQYEVKRGKWSFAHLPVIPPHFALRPIERSEGRLKLLTKLIRRKDVGALINACDAGREGELIFRYIVQHTGAKQPIRRLWLQSMTPAAIRDSFAQLRSDAQMQPLADAARCRSEADWLIGINGTRAMTAFNSKDGGFFLTTVGRVQTPTLAIVVEREDRIRKFVARDYWEVHARFQCRAGSYEGRWFDPDFKKREDDAEARAERIWDGARAEGIASSCRGKPGQVREESKPSSQLSPLLFDLTSLQREGNARFGFSAKTTLSLAQALYEKHKALTYPRTDSRALPQDYVEVARQTLRMMVGSSPAKRGVGAHTHLLRDYAPHAARILEKGWVRPNRRVFDDTKISDHFAIVPTLQAPSALSEAEHKIYDLVVRRFLAVFFPAAEYLVTTRITQVSGNAFKTEGKVLTEPGWLAVYGREAQIEQASLVAVDPEERVRTVEAQAKALQTKPPARYTEATLLSAMEGAGKLVDDDELRAAMEEKGLGTPATRAAIIEGLIAERYLVRDGRELHPTAKAFQLLTLLRGLGIDELTLPELTGEWEHRLALMEHGALRRDVFMREIAQMTKHVVQRAKSYESDTVPGDYATLKTPCPKCGATVQENYRRFACTRCDFSLPKHPASRTFEYEEVEQLLKDRAIGPLTGFRSKLGRPFAAALKISPEFKLEFDFGNPQVQGEESPVDFRGLTPLGPCPKCGANVYEQPMAYVCEKAVGPARTCDFRSGRVILQQPIEAEQMRKLLRDGRTDLLRGFVSNRTRRKFAAFLVRKPDGSTGFEFEPRPKKAAPEKSVPPGAKTTASTREARPAAAPVRVQPTAKPARAAKVARSGARAESSGAAQVRRGAPRKAPAAAAAKRPIARKSPAGAKTSRIGGAHAPRASGRRAKK